MSSAGQGLGAVREPVAVIGMAARVPETARAESLGGLLDREGSSIAEAPAEWFAGEAFDAEFFGIPPAEADGVTPRQRLLMEVAWEAFEDAGLTLAGVATLRAEVLMGGDACGDDAGRVSSVLTARGLSVAVDAACSSSLVGVHLAMRSLRAGDCEIAFAGGEVAGEGVAVVALKLLSRAVAEGDRVHAVIKGSSAGVTSPDSDGADGLRTAYCDAGVEQGAGTTVDGGGADGMVGLLEAVLSVKHGFLSAEAEVEDAPRRGCVSSLAAGGAAVQLVLEEPPVPDSASEHLIGAMEKPVLFAISARSEVALAELAGRYRDLVVRGEVALSDVAYSAAVRRTQHSQRLAVVAESGEQAIDQLDSFARGVLTSGVVAGEAGGGSSVAHSTAWVFAGEGGQWLGMGRELLAGEQVFAEQIAACEAAMTPYVDWSLTAELAASEEDSQLARVDVAQPAIFAVQVALAALWKDRGFTPDVVVGHSMGEVAAAHVAGILDLDDAVRVICHRSGLMRAVVGAGAMVEVELSQEDAEELLVGRSEISLAACNGPASSVLSGDEEVIAEILAERGVSGRRLEVSVASNSPLMELLQDEFLELLSSLNPKPGHIPLCSTVYGETVDGTDLGPEYWVDNLREPVLFGDVIQHLAAGGHDTFVEFGPHSLLESAVRQNLLDRPGVVVGAMSRESNGQAALLAAVAELHVAGRAVPWESLSDPAARYVSLPAYPWQRERFWPDAPPVSVAAVDSVADLGLVTEPAAGAEVLPVAGLPAVDQVLPADQVPPADQVFPIAESVSVAELLPVADFVAVDELLPVAEPDQLAESISVSEPIPFIGPLPSAESDPVDELLPVAELDQLAESVGEPISFIGPLPFAESVRTDELLPVEEPLSSGELSSFIGPLPIAEPVPADELLPVAEPDRLAESISADEPISFIGPLPFAEPVPLDDPLLVSAPAPATSDPEPAAEPADLVAHPPRPLVGAYLRLAPGDTYVWDIELNLHHHPYLAEHRLNDLPVLPASAYHELALTTAAQILGSIPFSVRDLSLDRPLFLVDDEPMRLQIRCTQEDGVHRWNCYADDSKWLLLATAVIDPEPDRVATAPLDLPDSAQYEELIDLAQHYAATEARGIVRTGPFRTLTSLRRRSAEILAEFTIDESIADELDQHTFHPALLESALQPLMSLLADEEVAPDTYLPVGTARCHGEGKPALGTSLWCKVTRTSTADEVDLVRGDIVIGDSNGRQLLAIEGFQLKRFGRELPETFEQRAQRLLHDLTWVQVEPSGQAAPEGTVLVIGDGIAVQAELSQQGANAVLAPSCPEGEPGAFYWKQLLKTVDADYGDLRTVLYVHSGEDLQELVGAMELLQALAALDTPPRLWFVTQSAQAVLPGAWVDPLQTALWGLGRAVRYELPGLRCSMLDLSRSPSAAEISALSAEILANGPEDELALRYGIRYAARLVPGVLPEEGAKVRDDATYLVVGGLRGAGLRTARWLVDQGARHLVLTSRSGPDDAARDELREMAAQGTDLRILPADVAELGRMTEVFAEIRETMPPLRGVIHAAGIHDDDSITELTADRFLAVMPPKVLGAWNLHALTKDLDLDFFTLYSSAASLIGSPEQGNYAAANAYLDGLAHYRNSRGLPALTVNWGEWATDPALDDRDSNGFDPADGLAVLGRLLGRSGAQTAIMSFDPAASATTFPALRTGSLLHDFDTSPNTALTRADLIHQYDPSAQAALSTYLCAKLTAITDTPAAQLQPTQRLDHLGIDSLQTAQLRRHLTEDLATTLPAAVFLQPRTIHQLAELILTNLRSPQPA
ncbi:type I polyketide synthase [Kribbella sp. CA-293567]|uniref:type I polyketide synthase n=1 Tax=Kribbella sp. CA-293567 TaxID=3002436 RepID=UPI0022DD1BA6|nr:SDR family NAD(P)-dependent oxidoreductase [Kribbella sp. CA-293567]WBQ05910.1 SDR family NAD(P)-dependent oxidoreductase [Kribbella sp. CA-293567]